MRSSETMRANTVICATVGLISMLFGQAWTSVCDYASSRVNGINSEIASFQRLHGKYPKSLDEMCQVMRPGESCNGYDLDFWFRPYSYSRLQAGYEFYSNGPDGLPKTRDDVLPNEVPRGCMSSPADGWFVNGGEFCPCLYASTVLLLIDSDINAFFVARNDYPSTLADLDEHFGRLKDISLYSARNDPWHEPYLYNRTPTGYHCILPGQIGYRALTTMYFRGYSRISAEQH